VHPATYSTDEVAQDQGPEATGTARKVEGVVLCDQTGRVVWWSGGMAARLAEAGLRWTPGMRCCDALQCAAHTAGDDECLTRHALAGTVAVAALAWRAGGGASLEAELTARTIRAGEGRMVAFEVGFRPPAPDPSSEVSVAALGRLSVHVGGHPRDGDWLQQRPGQVFRYLLAAREAPQRSEAIAAALWPDRGPSAVANVRYCVFKLREQLADSTDPAASVVAREAAGYRLDRRRLKLDVDVFQRKATDGIAAARRGEPDTGEALLTEALELYRGDFLADDPYADWAFTEREYLRALAGKGLATLAQIAVSSGRLVAAANHLQRLAQLEPFDSRVHQMLIEVCLRRGRRTEALRHYHALRARLQRAFGEQPDFELTHVVAALGGARHEPVTDHGRPGLGPLVFDSGIR
jgi:DNA-binding SARP family transcriptional activator